MNSIPFQILICMLGGYLIGTLNPAFLMAKIHGFDIRERGSGNAGASNAVITMGKTAGLAAALFDIAKAYFAVWLAKRVFPELSYGGEAAGVSAILGHIFPFEMGFRGGKGLASLGGVILAFNTRVFCAIFLGELLLVLIVDYICIAPISVSVIFPVAYYLLTGRLAGAILYALLAPLFLYKHLENLRRIRTGTEAHFSFLWRRDEEIRRLTHQTGGE